MAEEIKNGFEILDLIKALQATLIYEESKRSE